MINEQAPFAYFDYDARRVVYNSFHVADHVNSQVIAPEHMLLAIFALRRGTAVEAVAALAGSRAQARRAIPQTRQPGTRPPFVHLDLVQACKEAMVQAARQAQLLGDEEIRPEHLLLGLLHNVEDATARTLSRVGLTYDAVLAEVRRLRR